MNQRSGSSNRRLGSHLKIPAVPMKAKLARNNPSEIPAYMPKKKKLDMRASVIVNYNSAKRRAEVSLAGLKPSYSPYPSAIEQKRILKEHET
jgi:hypothetical protein